MPQLRIEQEDIALDELPMDDLKSAVAYVNDLDEIPPNHKYIYATMNDKTRVENTVTIRKKPTRSQWT